MQQKTIKTKDMVIAIFCTLLAILCIVFYFLPAFNIQDAISIFGEFKEHTYTGWDLTRATFSTTKVYGTTWGELTFVKDVFAFPVMIGGILMPLSIISVITTTVFAYLSWFKGEDFKKYCFLFSLCAMIFQTITLICTWYIALMSRSGTYKECFNSNVKGGMSYGAFVSLILVFVVAIIACAYNYFLDNFNEDDEDEEEDDDEEDDETEEEEEVIIIRRKKGSNEVVSEEVRKTSTKTTKSNSTTKKPTTKSQSKPSSKTTTRKVSK